MKKHIKMIFAALLFAFILMPAVKAEAAVTTPAKPSGLALYSQKKGEVLLYWNFDSNLEYYSDVYPGYYGYEVTVKTLKNKTITVLDSDSSNSSFGLDLPKTGQCAVVISNSKLKSQGFKFSVRSFVYDENQQKVYSSPSAEKVIIPRASITDFKALSRTSGKITWSKVSGAKNYTVYLSNNGGKSYKKYKTTSAKSLTISNMKLYKEYYVYVVANNVKYKGKKYNSTKPSFKNSNASTVKIYLKY